MRAVSAGYCNLWLFRKILEYGESVTKFDVTLETAISAVKSGVQFCSCWPPPTDATKANLIWRDIMWIVTFAFPTHATIQLILTAYKIWSNPQKLTKVVSEIGVAGITMAKMIVCRVQRARIQTGMADLDEFIKMASKWEREFLERCLRKCLPVYTSVAASAVCAATIFSCTPMYMPQPFPTDIEYPTAWEPEVPRMRAVLWMTEVVTIYITCSAVLVDFEIAMLLWFCSVRFEILGEEFKMADTSQKFDACIKKHQKLIESAKEVIIPAGYIAVQLTGSTVIAGPCCAYQLVLHQALAVNARFSSLFCCTVMELLVYAWPADNLMVASGNIAWAAYCSPWTSSFDKTSGKVYTVMLRAQKQLIVYIDGLLPKLNLDFYGKFLTTSFSYFTTLRAVTQ